MVVFGDCPLSIKLFVKIPKKQIIKEKDLKIPSGNPKRNKFSISNRFPLHKKFM
jgi:hypothetical protein